MTTMRSKLMVMAALAVLCAPSSAWAQISTPAEVLAELKKLRSELDQARAELQRLRVDLDQLKPAAPAEAPTLPAVVEMLQSQVAEHAQTKVESASRMPLKIFGTIHSSVAGNSGEANWLENPNIVAAEPAATGSFSATLRQTRLGIRAEGLELGAWQGSGAVVFDFFGGTPGFQTGPVMGLPRLLYAFARFERGAAAIHVGQDDMMLAPRNPTSVAALSFPLLFRSGNLYLRVPQARIESRLAGAEGAELRASFGIVSPIGGDYRSAEYTFVPPALGGERSKMPAFQGRLAWQQGTEDRGSFVGFLCPLRSRASLGGHRRQLGRCRGLQRPGRASWSVRRGVCRRQRRPVRRRARSGRAVSGWFSRSAGSSGCPLGGRLRRRQRQAARRGHVAA